MFTDLKDFAPSRIHIGIRNWIIIRKKIVGQASFCIDYEWNPGQIEIIQLRNWLHIEKLKFQK